MLVAALSFAAAVLLVVAGLAKLREPGPAASMIVASWPRLRPLSRARSVARGAAVVEMLCGLAVLAVGGRIAAAVMAACYLVLGTVAARLIGKHTSCGCFGAADGEVGVAHVVLNACALGASLVAVVLPSAGVATLFDAGALRGGTVLVQAGLLAALGYLSITALPALAAARRSVEAAR